VSTFYVCWQNTQRADSKIQGGRVHQAAAASNAALPAPAGPGSQLCRRAAAAMTCVFTSIITSSLYPFKSTALLNKHPMPTPQSPEPQQQTHSCRTACDAKSTCVAQLQACMSGPVSPHPIVAKRLLPPSGCKQTAQDSCWSRQTFA
jgi:hypothetical protein